MLQRLIRLPLRLIPRDTVVPVLSGINRGMRWRVGSGVHGYWIGTYERAKQRLVAKVVKPGMTGWDVGANVGFYTVAMSRLVGRQGRVIAFEPVERNVQHLQFHLALNEITNVTIKVAAVSDRAGSASFARGPNRAEGRLADAGSLQVQTLALDALGEEPDVVKIDIEGGELAALKGAARLIARRKTIWLVALDDPKAANECRRLLAGYRIEEFAPGEIIATP